MSPEGHFMTSRHVIDDLIDRHVRETGSSLKRGFANPEKPIVLTGDAHDQTALPGLRNQTTREWIRPQTIEIHVLPRAMGLGKLRDVVLGKVDYRPSHWIRRFARGPTRPGETVYALGYPDASHRTHASRTRASIGFYENSNGERPRISVGRVTAKRGVFRILFRDGFTSDVDGLEGSSGSATFNEDGELLGFLAGAWRGAWWARYERHASGESYEPSIPRVHVDLARTLFADAPRRREAILGPGVLNPASPRI